MSIEVVSESYNTAMQWTARLTYQLQVAPGHRLQCQKPVDHIDSEEKRLRHQLQVYVDGVEWIRKLVFLTLGHKLIRQC
jgi:hypothetical protein